MTGRGGVILGAWRYQVVGVYPCGADCVEVKDGQSFRPEMQL